MASQVRQLVGEKGRVEGQEMKEFYVQVMSNASTAEFPLNQANSFKNRLPNPLELREPGWKVGMSDFTVSCSQDEFEKSILISNHLDRVFG